MTLDLLIRGGTVYDGIGNAGRMIDVGVKDGRIVLDDVGRDSDGTRGGERTTGEPPATRVIDATGRAVMPGFIDIHSHSDFNWLIWPNATSKLLAGFTTDVSGNCGYGAFPLAGEVMARRQAEYERWQLAIDWSDAAGYFERLEATPCAINRAVLVGHGNVRGVTVGYDNRRASRDEQAAMRQMVEQGLAAGAFGLSSGLVYSPGCFADADELADLASVVAAAGGFYTSHIRSEGGGLLEAVDEFLDTLRRSGARGQLSHVKTMGRANWHKIAALRDRLVAARESGIAVWADRYPYTASATSLASMLLPRADMEGTTEQILSRLADAAHRRRLVEDLRDAHAADDYFDSVCVTSFARDDLAHLAGKSLSAVGELLGRSPADAGIELLVEDRLETDAICFAMSEENLAEILGWDFVAVGSDAGARDALAPGDHCHPRAFGTPAAFLAAFVREKAVCDLPTAARKLATMAADMLGLSDRGRIADGCRADLVVLDPQTVADRATYAAPRQPPAGIDCVIVNGQVAAEQGAFTSAMAGEVLRRT